MPTQKTPRWLRPFLLLSCIYFISCGLSAFCAPSLWWVAAGLPPLDVPLLMQAIGALMFALGFGCLIVASAPGTQWGSTVVLLIACGLDTTVVLWSLKTARLPILNGSAFFLIDLLLLLGFCAVLLWQYRTALASETYRLKSSEADVLELKPYGTTESLRQLSASAPLTLVFIRHAGCTFCRYHLALLGDEKRLGKVNDSRIVLVGMSSEEELLSMRSRYGLENALVLSDPERRLYRHFGLRIGNFLSLLGPKQVYVGLTSGALKRHGIGWLQGSGFQLHGVVIIHGSKVVASHLAEEISDYCAVGPLLETQRSS